MTIEEEQEVRETCADNFKYDIVYEVNENGVSVEAIALPSGNMLLDFSVAPEVDDLELFTLIDRANFAPKLLKLIDGLRQQRDALRFPHALFAGSTGAAYQHCVLCGISAHEAYGHPCKAAKKYNDDGANALADYSSDAWLYEKLGDT